MQDVDVPAIPAGVTALMTEPGEHFFESSPTGLNRFLSPGGFKLNLANSALVQMNNTHFEYHGLDEAGTGRWARRLYTTVVTSTGMV